MLLGMGLEGVQRLRVRRLQRERIQLAQEELSRRVNDLIVRNLKGVYRQLDDDLKRIDEQISETISYWRRRSEPRDEAPHSPSIPIRQAHTSQRLWEDIRGLVRAEADREGQTSEEGFRQTWLRDGRDLRLWQQLGDSLAQHIRLALERGLNRAEAEEYLTRLEAVKRLAEELATSSGNQPDTSLRERVDALEQDIRTTWLSQEWCPYRNPNKTRCSACHTPTGCALALSLIHISEPTRPY